MLVLLLYDWLGFCIVLIVMFSLVWVPRQQPHRCSGLANLSSVGAIP